MKILFFVPLIILITGNECFLQQQYCWQLNTQKQCENTDQQICNWQNGQCMKKGNQAEVEKCEDIDNFNVCRIAKRGGEQICTWKHGRCYTIQKCTEITDFKQCRNSYVSQRCQYVTNNVVSKKETEYIYITDIFDFNSCRYEDCIFKTYSYCPEFVNGRRCFLNEGQCTQCSYQTNSKDCIATKQCTWQNCVCSNILCFQITSKRLCNEISYCQYDFSIQKCEIKQQDKSSHCYNYNISSDPIKTKYNSFFGL